MVLGKRMICGKPFVLWEGNLACYDVIPAQTDVSGQAGQALLNKDLAKEIIFLGLHAFDMCALSQIPRFLPPPKQSVISGMS